MTRIDVNCKSPTLSGHKHYNMGHTPNPSSHGSVREHFTQIAFYKISFDKPFEKLIINMHLTHLLTDAVLIKFLNAKKALLNRRSWIYVHLTPDDFSEHQS